MRGIPSLITDIRKKVFTEVARMAYNGGDSDANTKRKEGRITEHTAIVMKYYEEYKEQ